LKTKQKKTEEKNRKKPTHRQNFKLWMLSSKLFLNENSVLSSV